MIILNTYKINNSGFLNKNVRFKYLGDIYAVNDPVDLVLPNATNIFNSRIRKKLYIRVTKEGDRL